MVPISLVLSNNSHVITCINDLEILVLKPLTWQRRKNKSEWIYE